MLPEISFGAANASASYLAAAPGTLSGCGTCAFSFTSSSSVVGRYHAAVGVISRIGRSGARSSSGSTSSDSSASAAQKCSRCASRLSAPSVAAV